MSSKCEPKSSPPPHIILNIHFVARRDMLFHLNYVYPRPFVQSYDICTAIYDTARVVTKGSNQIKPDQSAPTPFLCGTYKSKKPTQLLQVYASQKSHALACRRHTLSE